tara:strand:+ start:4718 stop:5608 length:891 start_codon:yes stop_codon:yes gene_type:complete
MKLICYKYNNSYGCGYIRNNTVCSFFNGNLKSTNNFLIDFISGEVEKNVKNNINLNDIELIAPIPLPNSFRDAYAFRQHVKSGRKNRGLEMIPEYDEFPVFYFSNHNSITGPGIVNVYKEHLNQLDFELEVAIVIRKEGINIKASNAHDYIFGYTIMNDWSARALQMKEMKLNLGPAKGKDFATSIGPHITTSEELQKFIINDKYNIPLSATVNGIEVSNDNLQNMTWSFAEIIERASYGTSLYPGDIIGSGTCGTGCFLELNGTSNNNQWLQDGDIVEIDAGILGKLSNQIKLVK